MSIGFKYHISLTSEHNRDYQSQNASLMFMPHSQNCDRIECVDIAILDDETVDILHEENFTVAMSIDSELYPNIRLDGTHAVVTIRDDESMYCTISCCCLQNVQG